MIREIPQTPFCLVSVEPSTGKNTVIWEPVESSVTGEFVVFRETNQAGVYEELGSVPQGGETMFTDEFSNSMIQASRYTLGFRDVNGLPRGLYLLSIQSLNEIKSYQVLIGD